MPCTTYTITPTVNRLLKQIPPWVRRNAFLEFIGLIPAGVNVVFKVVETPPGVGTVSWAFCCNVVERLPYYLEKLDI